MIWPLFFSCVFATDGKELLVATHGFQSPVYAIREKSQKRLSANMTLESLRLMKFFDCNKDLEVSRRLQWASNEYEEKLRRSWDIEIKDCPDFPWISGLPSWYHWRKTPRLELIQKYHSIISIRGEILQSRIQTPYLYDRKATELWLHERITVEFYETLGKSRTTEEFNERTEFQTRWIREDIEKLRRREDEWWKSSGKQRPIQKSSDPISIWIKVNK